MLSHIDEGDRYFQAVVRMNSCQVGFTFQAFWQSIPIARSKLGVFSLSYLPRVVAISIASALLGGGEAGACVDPRVPGSRLLALLLYIFHNLSSSITINHHNFCSCHFHLINRPPPFTIESLYLAVPVEGLPMAWRTKVPKSSKGWMGSKSTRPNVRHLAG